MKPRRPEHAHLPKGVTTKRGTYYLVRGGRWIWLGRTEAEALEQLRQYPLRADDAAVMKYAQRVLARAKANAKGRRGLPFNLSVEDVRAMLERCGWRCAVTRVPFSLVKIGRHRPYAPSIDRRDNALGYTVENSRMVCAAANIAMNVWGETVLRHLATSMVKSGEYLASI